MQEKQRTPEQQSAADIAREAFRRLAIRRIAPTPDAYREIFDEIAGIKQQAPAEKILSDFAAQLKGMAGMDTIAHQLSIAVASHDWTGCTRQLGRLLEKHLARQPDVENEALPAVEPVDASVTRELPSAGMNAIPLVDDLPLSQTSQTRTISIPLVDAAELPVQTACNPLDDAPIVPQHTGKHMRMMRDMLVRTWTFPIMSLLHGVPELIEESKMLAEQIKLARSEQELVELEQRLKQLCFKIEFKSGDIAEQNELLLRLFKLLLENVGELIEDDSWLFGQLASVRELLAGSVDYNSLKDINRNLKDVIYKQGILKHSLNDAKDTLKNMMLTFVERLDAFAESAGGYQEKIEKYSQQIGNARDITELNNILGRVMVDTRIAQTEAVRSRDQMVAARQEMRAAEARMNDLESQLREMSELVYEDQLTGSLNRRGLDDFLEHALARTERRNLPLCLALLDLDDFKRLNDTHGHSAGDRALIHLVQVVKDTLRAMDVIGRFGGEEFVIVLPDTSLEDAAQTVTRVQRELTKRIFMHNDQRLLITFSAGVALRARDETQASLIERVDKALYEAKKAGKNRVVVAI
jgi:diguanylate cyclase